MITDFKDFLKHINMQKCSYQEFCDRLSILDISDKSGTFAVRSDLNTFLNRVANKDDDNRKTLVNVYTNKLYDILVTKAETCLKAWFDNYVALKEDVSWYLNLPSGTCFNNNIFDGSKHSKYGRLAKNINFDDFFNTKKLYVNDSEYVLGLMKVMFEKFHIRNSLASPAFFDILCNDIENNYAKFWNFFMMGANKASIFNPYTYKSILDQLFTGEKLFAPVMGWTTYQQAFYNSKFSHFVATDVIPGTVNNAKWLHEKYRSSSGNLKNFLIEENKTVDLYLCPSEQLQKRQKFVDKYRNEIDAVLFSPPYFDLEIYPGEEQSVNSFPDYSDWLKGYWHETILLCKEVMKKEARLGFIISDYRDHKKIDKSISYDMMKIVSSELSFIEKYSVRWNARGGSRLAHKMRSGNFENLWLFEKV